MFVFIFVCSATLKQSANKVSGGKFFCSDFKEAAVCCEQIKRKKNILRQSGVHHFYRHHIWCTSKSNKNLILVSDALKSLMAHLTPRICNWPQSFTPNHVLCPGVRQVHTSIVKYSLVRKSDLMCQDAIILGPNISYITISVVVFSVWNQNVNWTANYLVLDIPNP